ncbi:MAG TPA: hypothetical protein VMY18_06410 [Acidobacteriota bacterium]|nr:hypothetical protein [Acidobacteriota bacterium]
MPKHVGQTDIAAWLQKIDESRLPLKSFFAGHRAPFSQSQYYRYKKKIAQGGVESLRDRRGGGNRRSITVEAEGYLRGYLSGRPEASLPDVMEALKRRYGIEVTKAGMSRRLKRLGLERKGRPREETIRRFYAACGGFELVSALAYRIGWPQMVSGVIRKRMKQVEAGKLWQSNHPESKALGRSEKGQFTASYNRSREVRERRFESITTKRKEKNFRGMSLASVGSLAVERKVLAMLSLPLLTNNGMIRSVNTPLGNALVHLCGFNYKQATLTKFMAELKYLGASEHLLRRQVEFWHKFWREHPVGEMELPILCYYVDGNTKALWSKKHVKKNKVTMLGRVMGCVEMLFIHDSFGRPIYFETYPGHAPIGEYVLSLFKKIEDSLEGPGGVLPVNRAIVMDAASNSVRTLRAFAAQEKYHYITSLDDNQWNARKIRRQERPRRYGYGKATLSECEIELEDSQEKGYLVTTRAIKIDWDYGKRTVIITSLDQDVVGSSEVVKAYFDRWPDQELQIRSMKKVASLNRVAGYGKREHEDKKVVQEQRELREKIFLLREALSDALKGIAKEEASIARLVKKERKLRESSHIEKGKRILPEKGQAEFQEVGRQIRRRERTIREIMEPKRESFRKLRRLEQRWLRLQGKEKVYSIDVELDEIMTFFRVSLVNIYCHLSYLLFGKKAISMNRLVMSVLHLPAVIEETAKSKTVTLGYNKKDPETMSCLERAIEKINGLSLRTLAGKTIAFKLAGADSRLMSTT